MYLVVEKAAGDYGFEMITVHVDKEGPVVERMRTLHQGADGERLRGNRSQKDPTL